MQRVIMRSKIHRATVTRWAAGFERSCGIAPEWMRIAGMVPGGIVSVDAGNRVGEQAAIA